MPLSLIALALAAQTNPPPTPPAPPAGMQRPDPDRVETRDQYLAEAARRFDRIDINRDGRIDRAERDAERAQMRDRRLSRGGDAPPPPPPPPPAR